MGLDDGCGLVKGREGVTIAAAVSATDVTVVTVVAAEAVLETVTATAVAVVVELESTGMVAGIL